MMVMALRVTEAEADVLVLQRRRARLVEHGRELSDERVSVTIQAQTYEPGARFRLREVNAMLAVIDSELRSVDAALNEAGRRLALAQQEVA
jgi:hypothetical protein